MTLTTSISSWWLLLIAFIIIVFLVFGCLIQTLFAHIQRIDTTLTKHVDFDFFERYMKECTH